MTHRPRARLALLFCCLWLLTAAPGARGVAAVRSKLSDFYAQSRFVAAGKISAVKENIIDVGDVQVLKGVPPQVAGIKIKIDRPADVAARLKAGDAVVVFEQPNLSLVHVGDMWLTAQAAARGP